MSTTGVLEPCTCGHPAYAHRFAPAGRRECSHMDANGPCRCRKFELVGAA